MSIAGHVSIEMLRHYSHIRQEAKRKAVASLDNVTIASQLEKWKKLRFYPCAPSLERTYASRFKSESFLCGKRKAMLECQGCRYVHMFLACALQMLRVGAYSI
jgi:hypothetical protein